MSIIPQQIVCDLPNCAAIRREVNDWYVVLADDSGAHIYRWSKAPNRALRTGRHFCGAPHALQYASSVLTPDVTKANRESTLELKPPFKRDGTDAAEESTIQ